MTTRRITFRVDNVRLFDALTMRGHRGRGHLGETLIGVLLDPKTSFRENVTLELFGISLEDTFDV